MTGKLTVPLVGVAQQTCHSESEIPSSTPTARFTDHGDGTVTDSVTSLMWSKCAAGLSGVDCAQGIAGRYTWRGALDFATTGSLAGYTDWRLPDISELTSIVELRCFYPAINASIFPNTPTEFFWSASPDAVYTAYAQFVDFSRGYTSNGRLRSQDYHARLVRGGL